MSRRKWTRHWGLVLVVLVVGCNGRFCSGDETSYDDAPFLGSLREDQRDDVIRQLGVERLNELPLYTIDVRLDLDTLTFEGSEEVIYFNRTNAPLQDIVLRLYPNARQLNVQGTRNLVVSNVRVNGEEVQAQELSATTLRIPLGGELAPGAATRLELGLRGMIPRYRDAGSQPLFSGLGQLFDLLGSGEARGADYGIYGFGAGIVNMGLWYPRVADRNEQGWDSSDPAEVGDISTTDLANYRVTINAPADVVVLSTGILEEEEEEDQRMQRTFVAAAVRSFAWQASRSYASQEQQVGNILIRTTYDRAHAEVGGRVGDYAAAAIAIYEQRFGPYPYTELDVVEAPLRGGAGGVEWPGLVTIGRMLYQDPTAATSGLTGPLGGANPSDDYWSETLEFVVAHEVSHQYWNAVVGSDSRTHPFIDESLAQFSAAAYFGERYGAARMERVSERQIRLNYHLMRLLGVADSPVDRPAEQFGNVLEYAGIVYGKGPFFFVSLRRDIGDGAFWQGMRTYYDRYRFRVADADDLPQVMAEVSSNRPVVNMLTQRWLYQTHGDDDLGRPTISSVVEPIFGADAAALIRIFEGLLGGGSQGSGGTLDPSRVIDDFIRGLGGTGIRGLLEGLIQPGAGQQPPTQPPGGGTPPIWNPTPAPGVPQPQPTPTIPGPSNPSTPAVPNPQPTMPGAPALPNQQPAIPGAPALPNPQPANPGMPALPNAPNPQPLPSTPATPPLTQT